MPPYFSLTFGCRSTAVPGLVGRFYEALFSAGFPFESVLPWGCPADMPLQEVVDWNQERLERGFVLGYTQDVAHDYRQILLAHPRFETCRVFIFAPQKAFKLIVPERDVMPYEGSADPLPERVAPLEELARTVWRSGLFAAIQTSSENGGATPVARLDGGAPVSALPFALLDRTCADRQPSHPHLSFERAADGSAFVRRIAPLRAGAPRS